MVKKSSENKSSMLRKPQQEVSDVLKKRIEMGKDILNKDIKTDIDYKEICVKKEKWSKYNLEYLKQSFDNDDIAHEYDFSGATDIYMSERSLSQKVESFKESMQALITTLESIDERLHIYQSPECPSAQQTLFSENKVFIVHGHDLKLKDEVARFVNKLGIEEIILDEQPNEGMTIIEKFEKHAQKVGYAIVLLTEDDKGYSKNASKQLKSRARQNVFVELGYFLHALGRKRMAILCSPEVEIPTDLHGVVYLQAKDGRWQLDLAKEMKKAGLDIDMNKIT